MRQFLLIALGATWASCALFVHPAESAQPCGQWVGRTVSLAGTVHWRNYDPSKNEYSIVLQDACPGLLDVSGSGALPCPNSRAITVTGRLQEVSDDVFMIGGDYFISNPSRVECH